MKHSFLSISAWTLIACTGLESLNEVSDSSISIDVDADSSVMLYFKLLSNSSMVSGQGTETGDGGIAVELASVGVLSVKVLLFESTECILSLQMSN